jgi:hypothetical protein
MAIQAFLRGIHLVTALVRAFPVSADASPPLVNKRFRTYDFMPFKARNGNGLVQATYCLLTMMDKGRRRIA